MRVLRWAVLLLALVSCGGSDAPSDPTDVTFAGTYSLQSVGGNSLPWVYLQSGATSITFVSDHLTIADGGSWTETASFQTKQNGQTTTDVVNNGGTWIRSGASIALTSAASHSTAYTGTFATNRLDLVGSNGNGGSAAFVFTR